jgi:mono/diheme cytochrome c family protein
MAVLPMAACAPLTEEPVSTAQPATEAPVEVAATETQPMAEEEAVFPQETPSAVRGRSIFDANCASCHGADDPPYSEDSTPAELYAAIRDGAGGSMPAFSPKLSVLEMWDALYYHWSLATSPDEVAAGGTLFTDNCVNCHGEEGDGSILTGSADFTDQEFMAGESGSGFFESIAAGVEGSAMPAWSDSLTKDEIWSLVHYVWTFAYEYGAVGPAQPTQQAVEDTPVPEEESPPTVEATVEPTAAPQETTAATAVEQSPTPEPSPTTDLPSEPDATTGKQVWATKTCIGCHGVEAEGGIGPKLAGTALEFDEILLQVRAGADPMPAFSEEEVSDLEIEHVYAWLQSLAPPTPTPAPTKVGLPPRGHLTAFWEHVNKIKVHSDFAKDASPDIGALHGRVSQAKQEAQGALREADLAIADIPDAKVQATIREVKGLVSEILVHADAALATQDLNAARAEAAKMVEISRLDSWPLASQAVKQTGYTGSVRVQVKDPAGRPIQGALVTALTAPNPTAARTGADGRVTVSGLAAVRVMQVKAYEDGLVYHEVHVTVPAGGRADASITLPGPSQSGQTPVASNASISPSSGAGDARVTFRMTGTDPQGHANIAEDQVFALNPDLGKAYVLRSSGGDTWETSVKLPNLASGTHTWYFFIVDHQCNTSNIVPLTYTVP